ncbi:MAG: FadR family transcriptional regulator [Bacteroidetes bacterium]|nr:FadR family transcriptional regulator [Bacteroidota bacterium]
MQPMPLTRLRPIEHLTQVDQIENRLEEYLKEGHFKPGDYLPKEVEIARALGVSRTAVREALSRFKTLGIIESRKNRGMMLTRPDVLGNLQRVLDPKLLDGETMRDMFEMRLVIEIGLAHFVFLRKTLEDIERLEDIATQEEQSNDRIERLRLDVEFHAQLYRMSGNDTIIRFQNMLNPIFDIVDKVHASRKDLHPPSHRATHRDLIQELQHGNPSGFRNKMESHLWYFLDKM